MDPHSFIARAEAQRWIGIAEKLLMSHDFVGSKTFAIRARESDPRLEAADQILAIADTLIAAEKRVVGNNGTQQPDFYAILQLVRFVQDTEHIAAQYRRLAVTLNPHQNRFPYSDQAFQLVNDAWAVLSNPMRKSMYDAELEFPPQQQMNSLGFNLEQQHHHQQHHQQQQQQHNFFSINHMGSGHERELSEPPQTFQTRVQQSHQQQQLQQHNFLSQPNPIRPVPVREQEQLFQQREQEQLFQQREQEQMFLPQVQPFQITSTPQQQTRPSPQPPQPQPSMQSTPPPPPAAPPQSSLSWPQPEPQPEPEPEPQQQHPFQRQPKLEPQQHQPFQPQHQQQLLQQPQPLQPQRQQQHLQPQPQQPQQLQPQPQPQPPQQLQPQPQPQPPQQQRQQQVQQEQSLEQNAVPVQLSTQINSNNGVIEDEMEMEMEMEMEIEIETETEPETEEATENVDDSPTFWTACPYCFYMYEYPRVYAECTIRCDNCKRAFQSVSIPSPPPISKGQEGYFCCWGFFPLGISMSHMEKNNGSRMNSKWTPFSPLYDASNNVQGHLNDRAAPKKNIFGNKNSGPRVYIDDVVDDVFVGISEPSDDSDVDWGTSTTQKKKAKRMKKAQVQAASARNTRSGSAKNLEHGIPVQEGVASPAMPVTESSKKAVGGNPRRQSVRVKKELGKLDLNVEFNNNEGEEPAPGMTGGNRGHGQGEEDNIEGIGFFEGLDEFLSSLPILSVVNDEKVKA